MPETDPPLAEKQIGGNHIFPACRQAGKGKRNFFILIFLKRNSTSFFSFFIDIPS